MTRGDVLVWLKARRPEPPAELATKLVEVVESAPESALRGDSAAEVMGALGLFALDAQPSTLDCALQLLAADAFVTYAFEAASDEGTDVSGLATRLLMRVRA